MKAAAGFYTAALYMRLSKEDEGRNESSSIATQRKMLQDFAEQNNFQVYDEYIDEGVSGTTFERPEFLRMKNDIEDGHVNLVITKDLSRLGRDYISTGNLTEIYFPSKGVRYIAINDGYDSENACTDIAPFRNVINEMYARDISRKIRSSLEVKMKAGEYISSFAPYGYKKDPENKNHLIVDCEAAPLVREIFSLAADEVSPSEIARIFNLRGIPTPAVYRCKKNPSLNIDNYSKRKEWTASIICKMLKNVIYIGDMAQGKSSKVSFKSSIIISKPEEEWYIVNNTHEPLITRETFNIVKNRSIARKNSVKNQCNNIFSGIAKCMDCGKNMSSTGKNKKGHIANLVCGGYKLYGTRECSNHFIDYETLCHIILQELCVQIKLTREEKSDIIKALELVCQKNKEQTYNQGLEKSILNLKLRQKELDKIIGKLYEDNIAGRISDDRLERIAASYELEEKQIKENLNEMIKQYENVKNRSYKSFFKYIEDITEMKELTGGILRKLVERIEIGQGTYDENGRKHQTIRIYYKFADNN